MAHTTKEEKPDDKTVPVITPAGREVPFHHVPIPPKGPDKTPQKAPMPDEKGS